ncbi:MAG: hypothetical protein ACT4NY_14455 [Pseudonocardiales bacterium]
MLWTACHEPFDLVWAIVRKETRGTDYPGVDVTVAVDTGDVLTDRLPPKLHRSVREFLSEHRNDAFAS